jgi:hypothetical protein
MALRDVAAAPVTDLEIVAAFACPPIEIVAQSHL